MVKHVAIFKVSQDHDDNRNHTIVEIQPAIHGNRFCKVIQRYRDHTGVSYITAVGSTEEGITRISHAPGDPNYDERGFTEILRGGWFFSVGDFFADHRIIYIVPA
jgi:hypothetical protein